MDKTKVARQLVKLAKELIAEPSSKYRTYFEKKLKKWNVDSPSEIPDDKKDDFFNEVDKDWDAEDEND